MTSRQSIQCLHCVLLVMMMSREILIVFLVTVVTDAQAVPLSKLNVSEADIDLGHPKDRGFVLLDDIWLKSNGSSDLRAAYEGVALWEGGRMPYDFEGNYPGSARKKIRAAINHWNKKIGKCISIVPKTAKDSYFVRIRNSDGCNAAAGNYREAGQWMSLNVGGCTSRGTVIHEFMHSLGFMHEHQRPDRDKYITIHWKNIQKSWHQWWKAEKSAKMLVPYNCHSIMHYGAVSSISIKGRPAFTMKNGKACSGGANDFQASDLKAIKKLYGCK